MTRKMLAAALIALMTVACGGDDDGTGPAPQHELVGTWVATGQTGVSPGLYAAPFNVRTINATFNANQTYTVVSTDANNANVTYTGTWVANAGTNGTIRAITLNQTTPSAVTSQGIFRVTGNALTYEVIQTQPAIAGFLAPTVQGGFGSTSYNGVALGATWTQNYTKQ
jgi:hypothetical protein